MGLDREGALTDHPRLESIVAALRPDIGGGHCGLTRGTCCQSSDPAEVIAQAYIFPPDVFSPGGFSPEFSGLVFQQINNVNCRIKENLEISIRNLGILII